MPPTPSRICANPTLGVYAMAAFPTISIKLLAMFGVIRSAGIMLASFFSMMLIRFGGHALAMLAGNLSRIVQSAGAQAGTTAHPGRNFGRHEPASTCRRIACRYAGAPVFQHGSGAGLEHPPLSWWVYRCHEHEKLPAGIRTDTSRVHQTVKWPP